MLWKNVLLITIVAHQYCQWSYAEPIDFCFAGFILTSPNGTVGCRNCPDGHYCPNPALSPIPCPPGNVSSIYISERYKCVQCSLGTYQNKSGQVSCNNCPDGHYCPNPALSPIPCPPGNVSSIYISERYKCVQCSSGMHQNKSGQVSCNNCPDGHYCPKPALSPIPCPPGNVSAIYISERYKCAQCSLPMYQNKSGQVSCNNCPDGYYCPKPALSPVPCPPGNVSSIYISERYKCAECSLGTYQNKSGQVSCNNCPVGYYCPKPALSPVPCPPGSFSSTNTSDRYKCAQCSPGTYQTQSGQTSCLSCPPSGYYCPHPALGPILCPPGNFSSINISDRYKCEECPMRTYQPQSGQTSCLPCPSLYSCTKTAVEYDQIIG